MNEKFKEKLSAVKALMKYTFITLAGIVSSLMYAVNTAAKEQFLIASLAICVVIMECLIYYYNKLLKQMR